MLVEATSLSVNVTVTGVTVPLNPPVAVPLISMFSLPSTTSSSVGVIRRVAIPIRSPAVIVMVGAVAL